MSTSTVLNIRSSVVVSEQVHSVHIKSDHGGPLETSCIELLAYSAPPVKRDYVDTDSLLWVGVLSGTALILQTD